MGSGERLADDEKRDHRKKEETAESQDGEDGDGHGEKRKKQACFRSFQWFAGIFKKDDLPGTLAGMLSCKPYMAGRRTATDKHLQALLDLRYVPEHAIFAAVDYAVLNMKGLANAGYPVASLNDADKAKIMYAAHHLGEGDVKKFIENTMTSKRAEKLLITQVGVKDAKKELNDAGANWVKAHRAWLKRYIERKIKIGNFMCDPTQAPATRDLLALADYLKNNKVK